MSIRGALQWGRQQISLSIMEHYTEDNSRFPMSIHGALHWGGQQISLSIQGALHWGGRQIPVSLVVQLVYKNSFFYLYLRMLTSDIKSYLAMVALKSWQLRCQEDGGTAWTT